jgi:hypothetical protein
MALLIPGFLPNNRYYNKNFLLIPHPVGGNVNAFRFSIQIRKALVGMLLVGVFLAGFGSGSLRSVHAQGASIVSPGISTDKSDINPLRSGDLIPWSGGAGMMGDAVILPATPAVCPPSIGFGETIQCSIASPGETDSYSFTATAGDRVYVRMTSSSGFLWPYIKLYGPDAAYVCGAVNITNHYTVDVSCALPTTGTYILQVQDYDGIYTGNYYLYLQRLNNPGNPASIASGAILTPAQNDMYTFTGNAGDNVFVRMSASFWAYINVYNPDGTGLCGAYNALNRTRVDVSCTLPSAGTYTILASDADGINIGNYYLYLQRLNNPGGTSSIAFGQTLPGTIGLPAEMDAYTFTGNVGDKVVVRMSTLPGTLWTYLHVNNPDGTALCGAYNAFNSSRIELDCTLPGTGTYSILAGDYNGTDTGDYYLHLQRLNNPGNTVPLAFGQTLSASITTLAEADTYTFSASAGDRVLARISQSIETFGPEIMLYDPDGTQICDLSRSSDYLTHLRFGGLELQRVST